MNETIFLSDDSHVLTTRKNKNMPGAWTELEVVKEKKLLVLEQRTTAIAAQAMASRLAAWRDEVSKLSTAAAAARLFLEFLDGTGNAEFTAGMLAERAAAKADPRHPKQVWVSCGCLLCSKVTSGSVSPFF